MSSELTIIIPAKNEEQYIGRLLESIKDQDYPNIKHVPIFIADAKSTDCTRTIAETFSNTLNIIIIEGGPVAVGRNNGAEMAKSEYLLFVDADVILFDKTIISRTLERMKKRNFECIGAYAKCYDGKFLDKLIYFLCNIVQFFSQFSSPFATGMYFCIKKDVFIKLGKFNPSVYFAEDYFLSKNIRPSRFAIIGSVFTTNRRFKKIGHWNMIKEFVMTALHTHNQSYFFKHKIENYWD